jgi:hypothetical protein
MALIDGKVDAVFRIITPDEPALVAMFKDPRILPMSFGKAEAISRIFPTIAQLVMPQGMVDYGNNIPAADVTFLAETNFVAVRKEVHTKSPIFCNASRRCSRSSWRLPFRCSALRRKCTGACGLPLGLFVPPSSVNRCELAQSKGRNRSPAARIGVS